MFSQSPQPHLPIFSRMHCGMFFRQVTSSAARGNGRVEANRIGDLQRAPPGPSELILAFKKWRLECRKWPMIEGSWRVQSRL